MTRKNGLGRPVVAGAVGVGIGLFLGDRLVKTYDWRTEWFIPAPLPVVFEALTSRSAVRQWWPSIQVVDDSGDDELRVGSSVDFSVHQAPEVARLAVRDPLRLPQRRARAAFARGRHG